NDFELFKDLVSSIGLRNNNLYLNEAKYYGLDDNTPVIRYMLFDLNFKYQICRQVGLYNNTQFIEYIMLNTKQRAEEHFYSILGGLLEANHNETFLKFIDSNS